MVKPLLFKGEKKKSKKRKATELDSTEGDGNPLVSERPVDEEDDSWVSAEAPADLSGPVLIVLPSALPSCIACDANGQVFASALENVVENDGGTAEPHDVRQVWIANKIAGTDHISLKGHHGNYLSCSKIGVLAATREAISPEETFTCIPSQDIPGVFSIQTVRETFLSLVEDSKVLEIRGDVDSVSFNTGVRVRMQARFKPRLKASKEQRTKERISRKELEEAVGRRLDDEEVRRLKKARVQGNYHEAILDVRVKGKHDKYS